jgi:hypothetical protein
MSTTSGCKYLPLLGTCLFGRDRREVDQLALQGDADIAAGRTVSRTEYKKRLAELVKTRTSK